MDRYEEKTKTEVKQWKKKMVKKPSLINRMTKGIQEKANNLMPEKVQIMITEAIKNMVKAVIIGSKFTTRKPLKNTSLEIREISINEKINFYKKAAAVSGAGTGAGGILLGMADFPILLSLKIKFLFDVSSLYGFDVKDYKERLFILYVFQLAFSSDERRIQVYRIVENWNEYCNKLPENLELFDWRTFQQEYRDYIDLAKMIQMLPVIGAAAGAYANYKLVDKLGYTAMNAYRLRLMKNIFVKY